MPAQVAALIAQGACEAIWTTRCVICDAPGTVLCTRCRLNLPYVDRWLACPRCGAPHGRVQCVDCNTFSLAAVGRTGIPFERCVSAIEHRGRARALITAYKDGGERRLAALIASMMSDTMPKSWLSDGVITFVPADAAALRRRGFEHMALIAHALERETALPCRRMLEKLPVADQRGLTRHERFANMAGAVRAAPLRTGKPVPERVILVDDVYTTGATLFAACDALHAAGVRDIRCVTFARVP
ncbi:MAG: phosphoribosyltransferase family protein [Coriobacteriaceae bacterium]|nr:phosphoribosyltransferase family protein [Coriobacteriaceae bacterium]